MLRAENITWEQGGKTILTDVTLHLKHGEWVGLAGPNGAGKSSLLKILAFLEEPTNGQVFFQGKAIEGKIPLDLRRRLAVVFQNALLLNTTVFENVAVGLKIRALPKATIKERVATWLERFGVAHLAKQQARSLSGGEAQRVSLARAFALEPDVLFLDEPFSALDAPTKSYLLQDLAKASEDSQVTALMVSHDFRELARLTQRTLILKEGMILAEQRQNVYAEGNPKDLHDYFSTIWEEF
ncbi:hypothetical protein JCM15765_20400 [Paradesulfitobacterium aromaticivorans]